MPPPPINFRNCPADPGDDSGLDHGGMKLSEQYSDGHEPQGAPDQETGALGVSHEALVAGPLRTVLRTPAMTPGSTMAA